MLKGKKILVTAGPTYEPIDPVRFIGNRSSGKMGYAIACELAELGAKVYLVSGPTNLSVNHSGISLIHVETASEMFKHAVDLFTTCHGAILSAAVADFTPEHVSVTKIKKQEGQEELVIKLKRTKDILANLGQIKQNNQVLVGFALETDHEIENARQKLVNKNLDFIVLNSLRESGAGFGGDSNKIYIIDRNSQILEFPLKSKVDAAKDIVAYFITKFNS